VDDELQSDEAVVVTHSELDVEAQVLVVVVLHDGGW